MTEAARPGARILSAGGNPPAPEVVEVAAGVLREGRVIGIPTDTVYGLAVDPCYPGATGRVFAAKERPRGVQLPVFVADSEQAGSLCGDLPDPARRLMERFWPGSLTIVIPRRHGDDDGMDLGDGASTVGLRCPDHPLPLALCRLIGPLATTSANRHGGPPATVARQVALLEGVALVLDGGSCHGEPSTVVDCSGPGPPRLLRAGRINEEQILAALSPAL